MATPSFETTESRTAGIAKGFVNTDLQLQHAGAAGISRGPQVVEPKVVPQEIKDWIASYVQEAIKMVTGTEAWAKGEFAAAEEEFKKLDAKFGIKHPAPS